MIQLGILSGKKAGTAWAARRFPVQIGRSPTDDLQIVEPGVWEHHLRLQLDRGEGFHFSTRPEAVAIINGQPFHQAALRNGDTIELGSLRMRFWLAETRQRGLRMREWLTWAAIAAVSLGQVGLVYWLLR
jgi:hypothetical protein